MNKTIIMLSGFKNAGKDTTCLAIKDYFNKNGITVDDYAFALPIKQAASVIFDIPFEVLDGKTPLNREIRDSIDPLWAQYIPEFTPRYALTHLGTDVLRKYIHEDLWIIRACNYIESSESNVIVITDLREPNEEYKVEKFAKEKGYNIHHINIIRSLPEWLSIASSAYFDNDEVSIKWLYENGIHTSEWKQVGLTPEYVINNDKTFNDVTYLQQVNNILKNI